MSGYNVRMKGVEVEDDGYSAEVGSTAGGVQWWDLPLPPCPDCGGDMTWCEAGYVPGTRKCRGKAIGGTVETGVEYAEDGGCGSMFSVQTRDGRVFVRRERFYQG